MVEAVRGKHNTAHLSYPNGPRSPIQSAERGARLSNRVLTVDSLNFVD